MTVKEFRWDLGDTVALASPGDQRTLKAPGKIVALTIDIERPNNTFASVKWACGRRTMERETSLRRA